MKTYTELIQIESFFDRLKYLSIKNRIGDFTFGGHRYLNQMLYHSPDWRAVRREVILRDDGFDLAHREHPIAYNIYVHHINPITIDDILNRRRCVFDLENLISVSQDTHNSIHYGNEVLSSKVFVERKPGDTCPWR